MTRIPLRCRLFGHDWHVRILADAPLTCWRCGTQAWLDGRPIPRGKPTA